LLRQVALLQSGALEARAGRHLPKSLLLAACGSLSDGGTPADDGAGCSTSLDALRRQVNCSATFDPDGDVTAQLCRRVSNDVTVYATGEHFVVAYRHGTDGTSCLYDETSQALVGILAGADVPHVLQRNLNQHLSGAPSTSRFSHDDAGRVPGRGSAVGQNLQPFLTSARRQ
jgi:hypothetical protein